MNERELIAQLDRVIDALLSGRPVSSGTDPALVRIAEALQTLPAEDFRSRLGEELAPAASPLKEENTMAAQPATHSYNSLMPYLIVNGASDFIDFLKTMFGAQERMRVPAPAGGIMHAEVTIEESVIELADAGEAYPARPGILHVYVPDVDATYRKALDAGATSVYGIVDQDYGDREASLKDRFGNTWYIATSKSPEAVRGYLPEGLRAVTTYLHPTGTPAYIDFLKRAFGAEQVVRYEDPDGRVAHARVRIGDSALEMGEAHGVYQPVHVGLHLLVPDVDAAYHRAVEAGGKTISPPEDKPYGYRSAEIGDPIGNLWFIAAPLPKAGA
jgi:PhnB protein